MCALWEQRASRFRRFLGRFLRATPPLRLPHLPLRLLCSQEHRHLNMIWLRNWRSDLGAAYSLEFYLTVLFDFACFDPRSLSLHLKIHSGEKSNKCNQCDFACSDPSSLCQHLKIHSGKKPNKCNQCDMQVIWGQIWRHTVVNPNIFLSNPTYF